MEKENNGVGTSEEELETPIEGSESETEEVFTQKTGDEPSAIEDDATQKRINDLMSKWQSSDAQVKKLEQELTKQKGQESSQKSKFIDPNYKPKDYQEFANDIIAEYEVRKSQEMAKQQESQAEVKRQVDSFMAEIKSKNPDFNQKEFSEYASRPGFKLDAIDDLKGVYERYQELQTAKKLGEEKGRKDKESRGDKVGVSGKSGGSGIDFSDIRTSQGGILDKAMESFSRLTK